MKFEEAMTWLRLGHFSDEATSLDMEQLMTQFMAFSVRLSLHTLTFTHARFRWIFLNWIS